MAMSSAKIAFTYLYNEDNLTSSKRSHACTATLSAPAAGHHLLELLVQFDLDMEQQTGSKSGKEYVRAVYCHPVYLIYMQSTSCKIPSWMKHKLESRLTRKTSITSDIQMTLHYGRKQRRTKEPLDESERGK